MITTRSYRASRSQPVFILCLSMLFVTFGWACVAYAKGRPEAYFFGITFLTCGGFLFICGLSDWLSRVEITETGVTLRRWILSAFTFSWESVEAWYIKERSVHDCDSFTARDLYFRVRSRRREIQIPESQLAMPGFHEFLRTIREYVRDKEISPPT